MRDARDRHERAVRCGGREWRKTYAADAYGEVVWFGRRGAGAKLAGSVPLTTEAKEPFSGKSTKQAVKPLRREGRNAPAALYARVHFCLRKSHARPRVQQAPGLPCALYSPRGQTKCKPRAKCVARRRRYVQPSLRAQRSNPCPGIKKEWIASLRSQ